MFIYKLSGCGFDFNYSHLNFRFCACFEQGVPWHSGNYRVRIHSETCTWHDKNIQSVIHIMEEPPFSSLFGVFLLIYVFWKEPQFSSVFFCLCLSCLESFGVFYYLWLLFNVNLFHWSLNYRRLPIRFTMFHPLLLSWLKNIFFFSSI